MNNKEEEDLNRILRIALLVLLTYTAVLLLIKVVIVNNQTL